MTDRQTWIRAALAELSALQNADGGWGYTPGASSNTEATAFCQLAWGGQQAETSAGASALQFLGQRQRADGAFALSASVEEPTWATPLAAMALRQAMGAESAEAAAQWLLNASVFTLTPTPAIYGYDTGLAGWPWTAGDYSFVEPTAAAMLLLKQQGYGQHERVREAARMLADRALPAGGWNYGEPVVLDGVLFPAIVPTALALTALVDEPSDATASGLSWLTGQRGAIGTLFSMGWAAIALNRWGLLDEGWVADVIALWQDSRPQRRRAMDTALCVLGLTAGEHPLAI